MRYGWTEVASCVLQYLSNVQHDDCSFICPLGCPGNSKSIGTLGVSAVFHLRAVVTAIGISIFRCYSRTLLAEYQCSELYPIIGCFAR
jgi:hypothetical protein